MRWGGSVMRHKTSCAAILYGLFLMCSVGLSSADGYAPPPFERVPSELQIEELNGKLPGAAGGGLVPKPIIQLALDLIKAYEGWSPWAYDDPAKYCTIGYGHLIKKD